VLEQQREFGLYYIAKKCCCGASEVYFLCFVISSDRIGMKLKCLSTIKDSLTPGSSHHVQMLRGLSNFDWQCIKIYARVTTPVSDLLKKSETSRTPKQLIWEWTWDADHVFLTLERPFSDAPICHYFNPAMPMILQSDECGFAITGILS